MTTLKKEIWFMYDGGCPLCTYGAETCRLKSQGHILHLIDARYATDHPQLLEAIDQGYDLDKGMVIYDGQAYFHGANALQYLMKHGKSKNRFIALFKRPLSFGFPASCAYPFLRLMRRILLWARGLPPIKPVRKE